MKKLNMLLMGAVAMAFAACDEPAPTVPPVQSNPQGPVLENATLTGSAIGVFADGKTLNLEDYAQNPQVLVLKINDLEGMPEGGVPFGRFEMADNENFENSHILEMTMDGNDAYVNALEMNETHIMMFGKAPKEREIYYRVAGYVMLDGTDYRMGGNDYYVAQGKYMELCMDQGFVIEDHYYLLSNATTWTIGEVTAYEFSHSDASPYDDPWFSYVVEVPEADCYWKIAPQSAVDQDSWDFVFGVETNGDPAIEGVLIQGASGAARLADPGKYRFDINMETLHYTITPILYPDMLTTPGGYNGWDQLSPSCSWMRTAKGEAGRYAEAVMLKDMFKFCDQADGKNWSNDKTWGEGSEPGTLADANNGGGDIAVPGAEGAYWATVDLPNLTYTLTPITSVGLIGTINGWDKDAPIEMTPNATGNLWTVDYTFVKDDDGNTPQWKIIINHTWDSNYGGTPENPWFDWGNFSGYEGAYTITFDLTGNLPVITLVSK